MGKLWLPLAMIAALLIAWCAPVLAQEGGQSPLRGVTAPTEAPVMMKHAAHEVPASARLWAWMLAKQQQYKQSLSAAVRELKTGNPWIAIAWISALGFAYGVVHASGPGHGKAVISSYVLANERTLRRGVMLSFLSALFQALSATTFVAVLALVLKATSMTIRSAEAWTETVSWAFVALVGAWLLYRQIRLLHPAHAAPAHAAHHHAHGANCSCGHAHAPDARQLDGEMSMKRAFAIAFAVGIRPCTGALALLFLTLTQGLLWAGIVGTFAMALGTAITVSALACLSIGSRELANRMAGEGSRWGHRIEAAAGLMGSMLVLVMGTVFFIGSLQTSAPL